jgi:iron complex outermembrane receptor protein
MSSSRYSIAFLGLTFAILACSRSAFAQDPAALGGLNLDDLLSIEISSAVKYAQTTSEVPASVTVITEEDIWAYGWTTLEEVLANVRGMYISNDRAYAYLGNRGFSRPTDYNNRSLLLLNGKPLNEPFYGSAFVGNAFGLGLQSVQRIEIVRGPGAAMYGSNAMLSVINVVTKDPDSLNGLQVTGQAASFGTRSGALTYGKTSSSGLEVMLTANYFNAEGQDHYFPDFDQPFNNGGVAEGLDNDRYFGGYGTVTYRGLTFSAMAVSREKEVPTASWETLFGEVQTTQDDRWFAQINYDAALDPKKMLSVRAYYDGYSYDGTYPYEPDPLDVGVWEDHNDVATLGTEVRLQWDPIASNRAVVGAEVRSVTSADYRYSSEFGDPFVGNWPYTVYSLYVQDELQVSNKLALTFGLRGDHYTNAESAVMPRGAAVFHVTQSTTMKLLYGKAFRTPTLYELNYEEEDYWETTPNLRHEQIETMEFVWEQRLAEGIFGTASLFRYEMTDLIDETNNNDIGSYRNRGAVDAHGLEMEINARFRSGLSGYASFTYQSATDSETDERLTNSPAYLVRAGLAYSPLPWLRAGANVRYDGERMSVWDEVVDSYAVTDLTVSAVNLLDHLQASFKVKNLFDTRYATPGGFEHEMSGIEQNGREFRLIVSAKG